MPFSSFTDEKSEVIGVLDNDYITQDNKAEQKIIDVIKNGTTKDATDQLIKEALVQIEEKNKLRKEDNTKDENIK